MSNVLFLAKSVNNSGKFLARDRFDIFMREDIYDRDKDNTSNTTCLIPNRRRMIN